MSICVRADVVRPPGIRPDSVEDDLPEEDGEARGQISRCAARAPAGAPLTRLHDPLLRRNGEDRAIPALQGRQLDVELGDTPLGNGELRTERVAASPLASGDELKNALEAAAGLGELRLLRTAEVRDVAGQSSDLGSNTAERVADHAGLEETGPKAGEEDPLDERPADRQAIVAETAPGGMAAVVAAVSSTNEPHALAALGAVEHAVEEVGRINLRPRPLGSAVSGAGATGPSPGNVLAAQPGRIPQSRGNDSEALVNDDHVFLRRAW